MNLANPREIERIRATDARHVRRVRPAVARWARRRSGSRWSSGVSSSAGRRGRRPAPDHHPRRGRGERPWSRRRGPPGLEGVWRSASGLPYVPGRRTDAWRKIKFASTQDCVILGFTPGPGRARQDLRRAARRRLRRRRRVAWVGQVGTGFTDELLELAAGAARAARDDGARRSRSSAKVKGAVFVRPELVCEVEYLEMTKSTGKMRAPSFARLRPDKTARGLRPRAAAAARRPARSADAGPGRRRASLAWPMYGRSSSGPMARPPRCAPARWRPTLSRATRADARSSRGLRDAGGRRRAVGRSRRRPPSPRGLRRERIETVQRGGARRRRARSRSPRRSRRRPLTVGRAGMASSLSDLTRWLVHRTPCDLLIVDTNAATPTRPTGASPSRPTAPPPPTAPRARASTLRASSAPRSR